MATKDLLRESFTASAQRVYRERAAQRTPLTTAARAFERLRRAMEEASKSFGGKARCGRAF